MVGVDEVVVQAARLAERFADSLFGDFVKDHALDFGLRDARRGEQVPRDSLALAVWVGRQIDGVGVFGRFAKFGYDLLLVRQDGVCGMKALFVYVDALHAVRAALLLVFKIAHMPYRCQGGVVAAEETPHGARFCG